MSPTKRPTVQWTAADLHAWHVWVCETFGVSLTYTMYMANYRHPTATFILRIDAMTPADSDEPLKIVATAELASASFFKDSIWGAYARVYGVLLRELENLYGAGFVAS